MSNKIDCRILIVDDEEDILTAGRIFLKQHFTFVRTEPNPNKIPYHLQNDSYDVIMLDMNYTAGATNSKEGFAWLSRILEIDPAAIVILITAYGDVELAVRALKEGATDFVLKPWQNEKLLATLTAACRLRKSTQEVKNLVDRQRGLNQAMNAHYSDFIGTSAPMQKVYQTIEKVGATDANVLILGENGTGKELAARALHRKSRRVDEAFVSVDLGAVSETLFESELFGHAKGAFTDAKDDRAGRFEVASGGTLFLDEIGNLSLALQSKLLTALQSRQITRLGTNKPKNIDIRLVCATNMPLYEMVSQGRFRQDLLYRINTVELHLPPLRERKEDIPLLAEHFLNLYNRKYQKSNLGLEKATLKKLTEYHWPGNIRELDHAIERAVILSDQATLRPTDFDFMQPTPAAPIALAEDLTLETLERMMVQKMLSKHAGNITHAARELGITRTALYRRIEKYGL
ncbi:sigma-54-dependent Fis family transcriptional regulator [Adhaeribacter aerolatus]|uniref:Sigma-54-dependent Fis family transcriptional regulator n=1 Tax=Adhaeribacter aerolatus TaxID=670289 RepID=A0A512AYQ3_9BACT|nr:sigma-54 dependent transcriptional regulator [Adhaeribacter aerolatus]GEO04852.1 sigma-54-dependent Fis family transcriptional regulator [Adhaeribacter aerolatus]